MRRGGRSGTGEGYARRSGASRVSGVRDVKRVGRRRPEVLHLEAERVLDAGVHGHVKVGLTYQRSPRSTPGAVRDVGKNGVGE